MIYGFVAAILALAIYGPTIWVKYVMWRHSAEIDNMPGTGGELARHLVDRFELAGVAIEKGDYGKDHYDAGKKVISLSPRNYEGKSLTSVAVATHEVGHAIQFCRNEPVSQLRSRYLSRAFTIRRVGTLIMAITTLLSLGFGTPYLLYATAGIGVVSMVASALMYMAILPEEYDASFSKALPILKEGYVPKAQLFAVRQVLRAAALTYVAGAIADILNLWRWIRVFR
jgi:Zn-dependent membrane protease YugP